MFLSTMLRNSFRSCPETKTIVSNSLLKMTNVTNAMKTAKGVKEIKAKTNPIGSPVNTFHQSICNNTSIMSTASNLTFWVPDMC